MTVVFLFTVSPFLLPLHNSGFLRDGIQDSKLYCHLNTIDWNKFN